MFMFCLGLKSFYPPVILGSFGLPLSKNNLEIPPCKMKILWFRTLETYDCVIMMIWHADCVMMDEAALTHHYFFIFYF